MFIKCSSDPTYILLITVVHCKIFSWLCLPQESHGGFRIRGEIPKNQTSPNPTDARIRSLLCFFRLYQAPTSTKWGAPSAAHGFFLGGSLSLGLRVGWIPDLPKVHGFLVAHSANTRTCTLKRWNGKLLALSFESLIFVTIDFFFIMTMNHEYHATIRHGYVYISYVIIHIHKTWLKTVILWLKSPII